MPNIDPAVLSRAQAQLGRLDMDGWLLYDFHGRNSISGALMGLPEGQKRRYFVLLTPDRPPVALVQKIEVSGWDGWPWELRSYVSADDLEAGLRALVGGMKSVAMEISPLDNIPYVDNVPVGVAQLVESVGPEVVSSVDLISLTAAQWTDKGLEAHVATAELLAGVARAAFEMAAAASGLSPVPDGATSPPYFGRDGSAEGALRSAGVSASGAAPVTEYDIARWIVQTLEKEGNLCGVGTIVAVGPNAAKPHYEPQKGTSSRVQAGQVFMVDLWGKNADEPEAVYADQTWMGFLGAEPPADVATAWTTLVASRDACVNRIRTSSEPTGAAADAEARRVLIEGGYGAAIFHRTGHGIDRELHGVGPTLDSIETTDDRRLVPGVGFSVEPGIYLEGSFGLRTEIDVHMTEDGPRVTPARIQYGLWTAVPAERGGTTE